jgi:hypothetical protein
MQCRHGGLGTAMDVRHTIEVHGCTNALKGRMPEKDHPEYKRLLINFSRRFLFYP